MELQYTHEGLTYYTAPPEHEDGCQSDDYLVTVTANEIEFLCENCGAFVIISTNMEPEEEDEPVI